jgi:hypothetical protein
MVGGNVHPVEVQVVYKIFEYENPPELKLLNGLSSATASANITSQDPTVIQAATDKHTERVKDGIKLVGERIESTLMLRKTQESKK